jgi:protease-4
MAKQKTQQIGVGARWGVIIFVLLFLAIISFISAFVIGLFVSSSDVQSLGNVAYIRITGPIVADAPTGFLAEEVASSTDIVELIEMASEDEEIKAILLEINSPGGTAVASYEIAEAVRLANKTTVAWIREAGASGAYWIATATDHVVANPVSIVGSIGVISSYIDFSGTLERYNASYQRLVSGKYKDMGSPFKKLTGEEEKIFQENLDIIRDVFIEEVAANRGMDG